MIAERGPHRSVYASIVDDADFQELSPDARLLFFILKLTLGVSGIDVVYTSSLVEKCGKPQRAINAALKQLRDNDWIRTERNVTWLRNGLRFEPSISIKNPKHITAIQKHLRSLPRLAIVDDFIRYYGIPSPWVSDTPSDTVSRTLPDTVSDTPSDTLPDTGEPRTENREPKRLKNPSSSSSVRSPARRPRSATAVDLPSIPPLPGGHVDTDPRVETRRRQIAELAASATGPPGDD